MADSKIRVTPQTLKDQAEKMKSISEQIYSINNAATAAMDKIGFSLFTTYSIILESKCKKVLKNIGTVRESMELGQDVALTCANRYENTDKVIRDKIGDLPEEVLGTPVSERKVYSNLQARVEEMKTTSQYKPGRKYDGNEHLSEYGGYIMSSWSCCAMSSMMQIDALGLNGKYPEIKSWGTLLNQYKIKNGKGATIDFEEVRAGDRIWTYDGVTKNEKGETVHVNPHWVFVIAVNRDENGNIVSFDIGEGNAIGIDPEDGVKKKGIVNYRTISCEDIKKSNYVEVCKIKDEYFPAEMHE